MQEALSSLALEYGIVSKKSSKTQIKECICMFRYNMQSIASTMSWKLLWQQDWANTEGCLHRALGAYVHRRLSQNSGVRLGSSMMCIALYVSMCAASSCKIRAREDAHAEGDGETCPRGAIAEVFK